MPALDGDQSLPRIGRCFSRLETPDTIGFTCADRPQVPSCFTLTLESPGGVSKGEYSASLSCRPDYAPVHWDLFHSMFVSTPVQLHFTGSPDPNLRLVMRIYEAEDHFKRRVVIPDLQTKPILPGKPSEWQ